MQPQKIVLEYYSIWANSSIYSATGTLGNEYGFGNLTTMNKIIDNLIRRDRVAQQEMIMGLDMNNVMDNNWILFCIWHVQLPFVWLSSH